MFFPDPIMNERALEILEEEKEVSEIACSHCYRKIRGKIYREGNRFFDGYCYYLRYILKNSQNELEQMKDTRR